MRLCGSNAAGRCVAQQRCHAVAAAVLLSCWAASSSPCGPPRPPAFAPCSVSRAVASNLRPPQVPSRRANRLHRPRLAPGGRPHISSHRMSSTAPTGKTQRRTTTLVHVSHRARKTTCSGRPLLPRYRCWVASCARLGSELCDWRCHTRWEPPTPSCAQRNLQLGFKPRRRVPYRVSCPPRTPSAGQGNPVNSTLSVAWEFDYVPHRRLESVSDHGTRHRLSGSI
ncbi:hypothetical protein BU26DRAFT_282095 [Trematosphaeria pertusa]|uniref:Uncharacterized protein n=1 Tax=Trematosphaeria pertusa TaxID=390896 RepID=A0A6A6IMD5_9PLEO|nr:uncharacterized protein BU26DRAFT_282095 [Trematosphaeria pertusa]KAF2251389.1 hypothetical protein BU26DRAFT_282095 [Trematosphaeria pertusa]